VLAPITAFDAVPHFAELADVAGEHAGIARVKTDAIHEDLETDDGLIEIGTNAVQRAAAEAAVVIVAAILITGTRLGNGGIFQMPR
jgi:hypothetical protein